MKSDTRVEDSLSVVSQIPEEAHDSPGPSESPSGGRLVQEQEKLGLSGELDSDCQHLPLFGTKGPNDSICTVLQTTHREAFLNIHLLLCHGNILRLTKNSRETNFLADKRSGHVCIHLLTIPSLNLEIRRESLTVHEPGASNNTDGRTLGENVQKRGLLFKHDQFGLV